MNDLRISETMETIETYGAKTVTTEDLLAIILENKEKARNLLHLVPDLFEGTLEGMKGLLRNDFDGFRDLGLTKKESARILASIELGQRIANLQSGKIDRVASPNDAAQYFMKRLSNETHERFFVMMLNTKNHLMRVKQIAEGSLTAAIVHPREVFAPAVTAHAACILIAHNHPSGDPTPSGDDEELTKAIYDAGEILGIPVVDHVIVGDRKYYSFREHGFFQGVEK